MNPRDPRQETCASARREDVNAPGPGTPATAEQKAAAFEAWQLAQFEEARAAAARHLRNAQQALAGWPLSAVIDGERFRHLSIACSRLQQAITELDAARDGDDG